MRVNEYRRRSVIKQIPPRRCEATSQRSKNQCLRWAMVGATVCQKHGGLAPQVRANAEMRITLAEALAKGTRRDPWEVLDEATHVVDVLLQQAIQAVTVDGVTGLKAIKPLVESVERAARLAKMNLEAGNEERRTRLAEAQAGQLQRVFTKVLNGLDLTDEQRALVPALLEREIRAVTSGVVKAEVIQGDRRKA